VLSAIIGIAGCLLLRSTRPAEASTLAAA